MDLLWLHSCLLLGFVSWFGYKLFKFVGLIMAYYFKCMECNYKETFKDTFEIPTVALEGSLAEYETVICDSCISNKTRLKGNHIIINRRINNG